jgi:hypothetical protein
LSRVAPLPDRSEIAAARSLDRTSTREPLAAADAATHSRHPPRKALKAGQFSLGFGAGGRFPIWNGVGGFVFNSSS